MTKNNSEQSLLVRIGNTLEDLSDHASTILNEGMAEVDWSALDNHAGEAVDIANFLHEWGPTLSENVAVLTESLKLMQDTDAWYSMSFRERNLIRSTLVSLDKVALWTETRSSERPLCLCRSTQDG
tara:strand:+ start:548 stop:925 length:378 start_codon:yes stop_codon:yes gene_type:complete